MLLQSKSCKVAEREPLPADTISSQKMCFTNINGGEREKGSRNRGKEAEIKGMYGSEREEKMMTSEKDMKEVRRGCHDVSKESSVNCNVVQDQNAEQFLDRK
jgi:hypothetical protein